MVRTAASKTSTIWSGEDEEQLLQMKANGASFKDIAAALGRSQASVESRFSILKKRDRNEAVWPRVHVGPRSGG